MTKTLSSTTWNFNKSSTFSDKVGEIIDYLQSYDWIDIDENETKFLKKKTIGQIISLIFEDVVGEDEKENISSIVLALEKRARNQLRQEMREKVREK